MWCAVIQMWGAAVYVHVDTPVVHTKEKKTDDKKQHSTMKAMWATQI